MPLKSGKISSVPTRPHANSAQFEFNSWSEQGELFQSDGMEWINQHESH